MNSGLDESAFQNNHLSLDEIKNYLPKVKVIKKEPNSYNGNYILIWK